MSDVTIKELINQGGDVVERVLAGECLTVTRAGKPYLYPPEIFDVLDSSEPKDWVAEIGDEGERYSYPEPLNKSGFFEDFFDHKYEQMSIFWHVVNRRLTDAA